MDSKSFVSRHSTHAPSGTWSPTLSLSLYVYICLFIIWLINLPIHYYYYFIIVELSLKRNLKNINPCSCPWLPNHRAMANTSFPQSSRSLSSLTLSPFQIPKIFNTQHLLHFSLRDTLDSMFLSVTECSIYSLSNARINASPFKTSLLLK